MNWTIGKKLFALGGLGLLVALVVGIDGYLGINRVGEGLRESMVYSEAVRNHLESDMMHDALRGDVFAAILALSEEEKETVRTDLREHSENFRARLKANEELGLSTATKNTLAGAKPALDKYIAAAEQIVDVALEDKEGAKSSLPEFLKVFGELEEKMESLSDLILEQAKSVEVHSAEVIENSRWWMLSIWALGTTVLSIAVFYTSRTIVQALRTTVASIEALASGDLSAQNSVGGSDEIGQMSRALHRAVEGIRGSLGASRVDWGRIAQERAAKAEAEKRERETMNNLKELVTSMSRNADGLAAASEELSAVSQTMTGNANQTASEAQAVSSTASRVSQSVQSVAAGAEQMSASIQGIAKSSSESARVANNAVRVAQTTNVTVAKLGDASQEIGEVVKVINSIAEQTNLLALNATIEAARAGEAGKGFAVVANEVKELAKETSKATENISRKIEGIQGETKKAVEAIAEISSVINQINELSNSIASAVDQQSSTTNEMGKSLSEAAKGSSEIVQSVAAVAEAAQSTTSGASDTQKAAAELARMASELQQLVGRMKG